jgi:branched-chain amino acid transport system substrate-binding protein
MYYPSHTHWLRFRLAGWFVTIACAALLTSCAATRPTLKIGLIAPFEGVHRPLGYEVLAAVKLALQQRNAAGGAADYGIELVALNDDGMPATAARQVAALAADPAVVAIIGPWQAETAQAAAPALQAAGLVAIIPAALPDADLALAPNAFRLFAGDDALAHALLTAIPPGAAVEIRGADAAWANRLITLLPATGSAGAQVILLTGDAEAVARQLTISSCVRTITFCFAGPSVGETLVTARAGDAANGLTWTTSLQMPACAGQAGDFCRSYQAATGAAPGAHAALAYDATMTLLSAIGASERPQRVTVLATLPKVERQGISGIIRFNAQRSWEEAPARLYRVEDRKVFR